MAVFSGINRLKRSDVEYVAKNQTLKSFLSVTTAIKGAILIV